MVERVLTQGQISDAYAPVVFMATSVNLVRVYQQFVVNDWEMFRNSGITVLKQALKLLILENVKSDTTKYTSCIVSPVN